MSLGAGRADVELLDQPHGPLKDRAEAQHDLVPGEFLRAFAAQDQIFSDCETQNQADTSAVLRNMADARLALLAGIGGGHVLVSEQHPPAGRATGPGQHLDQLALAVALDARDPEYLALAEIKRYAAQCRDATIGRGGEV